MAGKMVFTLRLLQAESGIQEKTIEFYLTLSELDMYGNFSKKMENLGIH